VRFREKGGAGVDQRLQHVAGVELLLHEAQLVARPRVVVGVPPQAVSRITRQRPAHLVQCDRAFGRRRRVGCAQRLRHHPRSNVSEPRTARVAIRRYTSPRADMHLRVWPLQAGRTVASWRRLRRSFISSLSSPPGESSCARSVSALAAGSSPAPSLPMVAGW
jgi:hypothetical protein